MASNLPFTGLPVYARSFAAEAAQDDVIIWEPRRKRTQHSTGERVFCLQPGPDFESQLNPTGLPRNLPAAYNPACERRCKQRLYSDRRDPARCVSAQPEMSG